MNASADVSVNDANGLVRVLMEPQMKGFDKGDRVAHVQYGVGTLTDVNEYHTVIDFDEHGVRKFVTGMVVLERSSIPPPARPAKGTRKPSSRARKEEK